MEVFNHEEEILEAADTRMVEIGTEISQRMIDGKDAKALYEHGQRIYTLRHAYRPELEVKQQEAVLYCLRRLSEKFDLPGLQGSEGITPLIPPSPEVEVPVPDFYIGSLTDVSGYIGEGEDVSDYIGSI